MWIISSRRYIVAHITYPIKWHNWFISGICETYSMCQHRFFSSISSSTIEFAFLVGCRQKSDFNKNSDSPGKSCIPNRTSRNPRACVLVCSVEWPNTAVRWVGIVVMCPVIWTPFVCQRWSNLSSNWIGLIVWGCRRTMMIVQWLFFVSVSTKLYRFLFCYCSRKSRQFYVIAGVQRNWAQLRSLVCTDSRAPNMCY